MEDGKYTLLKGKKTININVLVNKLCMYCNSYLFTQAFVYFCCCGVLLFLLSLVFSLFCLFVCFSVILCAWVFCFFGLF